MTDGDLTWQMKSTMISGGLSEKAVLEEKPDAFLIGEIWEDAEQWLMGDQFDSAMNYRFVDICKAFFARNDISVDDFDNSLGYMLMRYKKQITQVQMNMLDTHDVPSFFTIAMKIYVG